MEIAYCLTLLFIAFFNRGHALHVELSAILLQFHELVLKRHLLMHPSPFHDDVREGYNDKAIEHHHLYACEVKASTIIIFASPQFATDLALRRFIRAIFKFFLLQFLSIRQLRL